MNYFLNKKKEYSNFKINKVFDLNFFLKITSSSTYVRKESIKIITQISELQSKSLYSLIQPFQDKLKETVGPRKHLKIRHYS